MENPWNGLVEKNGERYLQDDKEILDHFKNRISKIRSGKSEEEQVAISKEKDFDLRYFPLPYVGNKDAMVWVLSCNPLTPSSHELDIHNSNNQIFRENLNHESKCLFFFESLQHSEAKAYWWRKLSPLFDGQTLTDSEKMKRLAANFFLMEICGYHSVTLNTDHIRIKGNQMKSVAYNHFLLEEAAKEKARVFVILKNARYWLNTVPALLEHPNCFILRGQNFRFSKYQLSPPCFKRIHEVI